MNSESILFCIFAVILGMLVFHMLSNVCGCKVVEGQPDPGAGPGPPPSMEQKCMKKFNEINLKPPQTPPFTPSVNESSFCKTEFEKMNEEYMLEDDGTSNLFLPQEVCMINTTGINTGTNDYGTYCKINTTKSGVLDVSTDLTADGKPMESPQNYISIPDMCGGCMVDTDKNILMCYCAQSLTPDPGTLPTFIKSKLDLNTCEIGKMDWDTPCESGYNIINSDGFLNCDKLCNVGDIPCSDGKTFLKSLKTIGKKDDKTCGIKKHKSAYLSNTTKNYPCTKFKKDECTYKNPDVINISGGCTWDDKQNTCLPALPRFPFAKLNCPSTCKGSGLNGIVTSNDCSTDEKGETICNKCPTGKSGNICDIYSFKPATYDPCGKDATTIINSPCEQKVVSGLDYNKCNEYMSKTDESRKYMQCEPSRKVGPPAPGWPTHYCKSRKQYCSGPPDCPPTENFVHTCGLARVESKHCDNYFTRDDNKQYYLCKGGDIGCAMNDVGKQCSVPAGWNPPLEDFPNPLELIEFINNNLPHLKDHPNLSKLTETYFPKTFKDLQEIEIFIENL
jgi:hypothetical protein